MSEYGKSISIKFLRDVDAQIAFSGKKHGCGNRSEYIRLAVHHMLLSDGLDNAVDRVRSMLVNHDNQFERLSNELVQTVTAVGNRMEVVNDRTQTIFTTVHDRVEKYDSTVGSSVNRFDTHEIRLDLMSKELAFLALQVAQLTAANVELVKTLTHNVVSAD